MSVFDGLPDTIVDVLGEAVTIEMRNGQNLTVQAIFTHRQNRDEIFDAGAVITDVYLSGRAVDLGSLPIDSSLSRGGRGYLTGAPMADRGGMVKIPLRRA